MFCCLWSGLQTVYDEWFITLYNMVYTALPVLGMSLFDQVCTEGEICHFRGLIHSHLGVSPQRPLSSFTNSISLQDVNDRWSFQYPQLYAPGPLNLYFNKKAFVRCMMHSCYSSLILFFIPWAAMYDTVRDDGKDIADYQSFALLAQTCLLIVVNIQVS